MYQPLAVMFLLIAAGLLVRIAIEDYRNLIVRNRMVGALLLCYLGYLLFTETRFLVGDFAAAGVLFGIGLISWLLKVMGGGDVKLLFALGLLVGFAGLGIFAVILLLSCVAGYVLLIIARRRNMGRLSEISLSGRVPYAVFLVIAALPPLLMRASA